MRSVRFVVVLLMMRPAAYASADKVTFNEDVFPILQRNCQVCHRPGEIGPMPLLKRHARGQKPSKKRFSAERCRPGLPILKSAISQIIELSKRAPILERS